MTMPQPAVRLATFEDAEPIADLPADACLDDKCPAGTFLPTTAVNALRGLHLTAPDGGLRVWVLVRPARG